MPLTTVVGMQWGDEGKGRVIDLLGGDVFVRMNGGPNAGHTIQPGLAVHQVPPGVLVSPSAELVIAAGSVVDPAALVQEVRTLRARGASVDGRLFVSPRAHVITDAHRERDGVNVDRLGSTGSGNGPAYSDRHGRVGVPLGSCPDWIRQLEREGVLVLDTETFLRTALEEEDDVVLLAAHGTMLDINFGTYPYVTSSHCTAAGALVGAGLAPRDARDGVVVGVVKAYTTRVAAGPLRGAGSAWGESVAEAGQERGTTTGRVRRVAPLDLGQLHYAAMLNRPDLIVLNKVDVLATGEEIPIIYDAWTDPVPDDDPQTVRMVPGFTPDELLRAKADPRPQNLPQGLQMMIGNVEAVTGARVIAVGIGPRREDVIDLQVR